MFRENKMRPGDARRIEEDWAKEEAKKLPENQAKKIIDFFLAPRNISEDCGYLVDNRLSEDEIIEIYDGAKLLSTISQEELIKLGIKRDQFEKIRYGVKEIIDKYNKITIPEAIEVEVEEAA